MENEVGAQRDEQWGDIGQKGKTEHKKMNWGRPRLQLTHEAKFLRQVALAAQQEVVTVSVLAKPRISFVDANWPSPSKFCGWGKEKGEAI